MARSTARRGVETGTSALLIVPEETRRGPVEGHATGPLSTFKDLAATRGDRLP